MTSLVFPASPSTGDTFPDDDPRWVWTGTRWKSLGVRPGVIPDPSEQPIGLSIETAGSSYGLRRYIRDAVETVELVDDDDTWMFGRRGDGAVVGVRASSFTKTTAGDPDTFNTAQSFANVSGDINIRLTNGWAVRFASTAGNWGVDLEPGGYSTNRMFRWTLTVDTSDDTHKPTWPANWRFPDGEPATTLFEADKRVILSLEWFPQTQQFIVHLVDSGATPVEEVDDTPPVDEPDPGDPLTETGETVTVAGDANKVTMSVTPGDGTLSTTWSHGTFVLFQFRYRNFTDNLGYQWDSPTNNTSRVLAGLNNVKLYEVQVRLYNNVVKVWQDWQTVVIAPDGTTQDPDPEPDPEAPPVDPGDPAGEITSRMNFTPSTTPSFAEGRLRWRQRGTSYGPRTDFGSWMTPRSFVRLNAGASPGVVSINEAIRNSIEWSKGNYDRGEVHSEAVTFAEAGNWPFVSLTWRLVRTNNRNSHPPTNNMISIMNLAETAAGDHDAHWQSIGAAIQNSTYGGYDDWQDRVVLHLAHEHNGFWTPNYSGVDENLIGRPELVGATNSRWGSATAAAMRLCGETGNRGAVFQLAFHRAVTQMRETCPNILIDLTSAAVSALPDSAEPNVANLSSQLNVPYLPEPEYLECFGYDTYWRGGNRPIYIGPSGNQSEVINSASIARVATSRTLQASATEQELLNHNNWIWPTRLKGVVEWYRDYAKSKGRPMGLWETGTQYPEAGITTAQYDAAMWETTVNDNEAREGWKWMIELFSPTIDFTRAVYWHSPGDSKVTQTYRIDWADPALYPKTRAYLASVFSKP